MFKTRNLVNAAAAAAVAMAAAGCGGSEYKHCSDLHPPARQACLAKDNSASGGGYYYGGYWYYGPRTLARPGFSGVRYSGGSESGSDHAVGGFGESGHGSS